MDVQAPLHAGLMPTIIWPMPDGVGLVALSCAIKAQRFYGEL